MDCCLGYGGPTTRARAVAVGLLLLASCNVPIKAPVRDDGGSPPWNPEGSYESSSGSIPDWTGEPRSWQKLAKIEEWLRYEGSSASDFWRIEGELELSEGRLELAQREVSGDAHTTTLDSGTLTSRTRAAEAGFRRVMADPAASSAQKLRANVGVTGIKELYERLRSEESLVAVVPRSRWGARGVIARRLTPATDDWTRITIHHSAEAYGPELDGSLASSAEAIRKIQRAHIDASGYGDIGYHFLIGPSGRVFEGRSLEWQGAHAYRDNNIGNVGICVLGNFEETSPTPEALHALDGLVADLSARYDIPRSRVYAHREFRTTLCPGRNLMVWVTAYRRR